MKSYINTNLMPVISLFQAVVKAHMVAHNEEKGYQCSVCEKLFFNQWQFKSTYDDPYR